MVCVPAGDGVLSQPDGNLHIRLMRTCRATESLKLSTTQHYCCCQRARHAKGSPGELPWGSRGPGALPRVGTTGDLACCTLGSNRSHHPATCLLAL